MSHTDSPAEIRSDESTATPRPRRRHLIERSASGGPIVRLDDALLMRGGRATWLLDIDVEVGGAHRRLQVPIGRHKVLDRLILELERAIRAGGRQAAVHHDGAGQPSCRTDARGDAPTVAAPPFAHGSTLG